MVDYVKEFEESFARVTAPALCDRFLSRFYQRFMATDETIKGMFGGTAMAHQQDMLRESLAEMVDFYLKRQSNPYLVTLARIHGVRGRNVEPAFYDDWMDSLAATVREIDPAASDSVELAWRIVMAPGIEFMKFYRAR
jgi:truncated hemoglobin YjbI